jgi:hypothetical protein
MRSKLICVLSIVSGLGGAAMVAGCTADVHDNEITIKDPKVTFNTDVDVDRVEQGATMPIDIDVSNVDLVPPDQKPSPDVVNTAAYLVFFFDSFDSQPLLITAETHVEITIPLDAKPGPHKVLCRVNKHDGTPTEATFELDITVIARATTG